MSGVGGVVTTLAGSGAATGYTRQTRYDTDDWKSLYALMKPYANWAWVPGMNPTSSGSLNQYSAINGTTITQFTAGAGATVTTDGTSGFDYGDFTDDNTESWTTTGTQIAPTTTEDFTMFAIASKATAGGADNSTIIGQETASSNQRFSWFISVDESVRVNNGTDGSASIVSTSGNEVTLDEVTLLWMSYDHSATTAYLGKGTTGTASTSGALTAGALRGGSGIEIGATAGASPAIGRIYGIFCVNALYTDMVDSFGENAFPKILTKLDAIFL